MARLLSFKILRPFVLCSAVALTATHVATVLAADTDFVVIAHVGSPSRLERAFVADVFLKKKTRWANDTPIRVVDQKASSRVRRAFSEGVLKRSVEAVRSYWQQRIFSGRDVPPAELDSDEAVVKYVNRNAGSIGYVSAGQNLGGVQAVVIE